MKLKRSLEKIPLCVKVLILIIIALCFFFFIKESDLIIFSIFNLVVVAITGVVFYIIERRTFWVTVKLWIIGTGIYLIFAIPLTYFGCPLSPFIKFQSATNRYLFSIFFPLRLLVIFFVGLIFVEITSPIEFLKFGKIGLWFAFFFRIIEYTKQLIIETMIVLQMQGEWPDEGKGLFQLREARLIKQYAPKLLAVVFRNIILWFPWAYLCFNKIFIKIKESRK